MQIYIAGMSAIRVEPAYFLLCSLLYVSGRHFLTGFTLLGRELGGLFFTAVLLWSGCWNRA